ncbi:MAG: hypothetical protein RI894_2417, partial [Bacteroidota bacterium]
MHTFFKNLSAKTAAFATTRNTLILFALWLVFQVVLAKAGGAIQAESG